MRLLLYTPILVTTLGCFATIDKPLSKANSPQELNKVDVDHHAEKVLRLSKIRSESFFNTIKIKEVSEGLSLPKGQAHSNKGIISCERDGSMKNCFLRAYIHSKQKLYEPQKLSSEIKSSIYSYIESVTPKLLDKKLVQMNISCAYVSKNYPPYQGEQTKCHIHHPRQLYQFKVYDHLARKLALLSAGNENIILKASQSHASLECFKLKHKANAQCILRRKIKGLLEQRPLRLSNQLSQSLYSKMKAEIYVSYYLENKSTYTDLKIPKSMVSNLTCSTKPKSTKTFTAACQVTLNH